MRKSWIISMPEHRSVITAHTICASTIARRARRALRTLPRRCSPPAAASASAPTRYWRTAAGCARSLPPAAQSPCTCGKPSRSKEARHIEGTNKKDSTFPEVPVCQLHLLLPDVEAISTACVPVHNRAAHPNSTSTSVSSTLWPTLLMRYAFCGFLDELLPLVLLAACVI